MDKEEFSRIRRLLGKTQNHMAQILCVSPKAIQSFEQGWRNIPAHIQREMLLLWALKESSGDRVPACWEIQACPDEWKKKCMVWELKIESLCWYFNGTFCQGQIHKSWDEKIQKCRECKVYQSIFNLKSPDQVEKRIIEAEILVNKSASNQVDSKTKENKQ